MELGMLVASLVCLLAVIVSAEESRDPSQNEQKTTLSKLEEEDHGPLMKALLTPGENSSSESPELQRDKRHKKGYGERATWKKRKGGCGGGCGGGGYKTPVIVVPVYLKTKGYGGGGGCGSRCGGGYQSGGQCGGGQCGGGGGGSYSYAQASAGSFSGGKK